MTVKASYTVTRFEHTNNSRYNITIMRICKLNQDQRITVLRMFGEGMDSGAIKREVGGRFGITISATAILQTCRAKKNQSFVNSFRETYLAKVRDVPIANKRIRMDDLEKERVRLNKMIESNPLKSKSEKLEYLRVASELRRMIDTAREEMEKKPHLIQQAVMNFAELSDEQLHARKDELLREARRLSGKDAGRSYRDSESFE